MSNNKHLLFFSNYCNFSKEAMTVITKQNLKKHFMFINVDSNREKLPVFVDRVPLVYTSKKEIVTDSGVFEFIDFLYKQVLDNVQPFSLSEMSSTLSDQFSFIESTNSNKSNGSYVSLNDDFHIDTPQEADTHNNIQGNGESSSLDRFISERDMDIQRILTNVPR